MWAAAPSGMLSWIHFAQVFTRHARISTWRRLNCSVLHELNLGPNSSTVDYLIVNSLGTLNFSYIIHCDVLCTMAWYFGR